jgi:hypothetical protein
MTTAASFLFALAIVAAVIGAGAYNAGVDLADLTRLIGGRS